MLFYKAHQKRLTNEQIVTSIFRSVLKREPDNEGLRHHIEQMEAQGLDKVLADFLSSDEFKVSGKEGQPNFELNYAPPMIVETSASPKQLEVIWQHISEVWSAFGENDPLWSVVTDERFRSSSRPSTEVIDSFYAAGQGDVNYMNAYLARANLSDVEFPVIAEYGCGVGRVTRWLAPRFKQVRAFDISASHLDAARTYLTDKKLINVEFVPVKDRIGLSRLEGIDLFFSIITLQHNPPPVILDILGHAFEGLNPFGVAFFQVPTYSKDYFFNMDKYWAQSAAKKEMEMHFVPQNAILELADRHGLRLMETRQDHCVGDHRDWISNTFLMRKR